jgi:hypothetical protein
MSIVIVKDDNDIATTTDRDDYQRTCNSVTEVAIVKSGESLSVNSIHSSSIMFSSRIGLPTLIGVLLNVLGLNKNVFVIFHYVYIIIIIIS